MIPTNNSKDKLISEAVERFEEEFVLKEDIGTPVIGSPSWDIKLKEKYIVYEIEDFLSSEISTAIDKTREGLVEEIGQIMDFEINDDDFDPDQEDSPADRKLAVACSKIFIWLRKQEKLLSTLITKGDK